MPSMTFDISVGSSNIGQVLKAQLVTTAGATYGAAVLTGFAMPTTGVWTSSIGTWTGTIPDGFQGAVQILRNSDDALLFVSSINVDTSGSAVGPLAQTIHVQDGSAVAIPNADVSMTNGDHTATGTTDGSGNVTLGVYDDTWTLIIIKDGKDYTPSNHTITDPTSTITASMTDESAPVAWTYADQTDVEDAVSANNLVIATQQDGTSETIDTARLLRAAAWADAYMNKRIGKKYVIPLSTVSDDDHEILRDISVSLVMWVLSGWKIIQFADTRISAQRLYDSFKKSADEQLASILADIITLTGELSDAVTAPTGNVDTLDISGNRMYAKDVLYPYFVGPWLY